MQQGATNGGRLDPLYEAYRALAEMEAAVARLAAYARLWVKKKEGGKSERGVARTRVTLLPSADIDEALRALEELDSVVDRAIAPVYAYVGAVAASTGSDDVASALRELVMRLSAFRRLLGAARAPASQAERSIAVRRAMKAAADLALYMKRAVELAASAARRSQEERAAARPRLGVHVG